MSRTTLHFSYICYIGVLLAGPSVYSLFWVRWVGSHFGLEFRGLAMVYSGSGWRGWVGLTQFGLAMDLAPARYAHRHAVSLSSGKHSFATRFLSRVSCVSCLLFLSCSVLCLSSLVFVFLLSVCFLCVMLRVCLWWSLLEKGQSRESLVEARRDTDEKIVRHILCWEGRVGGISGGGWFRYWRANLSLCLRVWCVYNLNITGRMKIINQIVNITYTLKQEQ